MKRDWVNIVTWTFAVVLGVASWLLVILAIKAFTMPAIAYATGSPYVRADLEVAQRYWQTDVCRGQWQVKPDYSLPSRNAWGEATGLNHWYVHDDINPHVHKLDGEGKTHEDGTLHGWRLEWSIRECVFTLYPELHGGRRRCAVGHEMGHFIYGPAHVGPMAEDIWHKCYAIADAIEAASYQYTPKGDRCITYRRAGERAAQKSGCGSHASRSRTNRTARTTARASV